MKKITLLFVLYILFYSILIFVLNQGLFSHDTVQLFNAIDDKEIFSVVNGRVGMYYLYYFSNFRLISVILSVSSILIVYLIGEELFNDGKKLAFIFSLIPPFLSISLYPNSKSVQLFLLLLSFYFFIKNKLIFSIIPILFSLFFRADAIFLFIVYIIDMLREKHYINAVVYIIFFLNTLPLLFLKTISSDINFFSFNPLVIYFLMFSLGVIPFHLVLGKSLNKKYFVNGMILSFPFIFVPSAKAIMFIMPLFFIILSIYKNKKLLYFFIPMFLISLTLMFSYLYYDSIDDLIIEKGLCKEMSSSDFSLFINRFGSDRCENENFNATILFFLNSGIFPNLIEVEVLNNTIEINRGVEK